jgi:hypothetical protein
LARIFGHLTLRYTRTRLCSDFHGFKEIHFYEVLASDSDSIAISHWDSLLEEKRIRHLHFEGDRYWISIGHQREWFKRVKK